MNITNLNPDTAIGAVGPTVSLGDIADDACGDKFAEAMVAAEAMALVAHLGGNLIVIK